MTWNGKILNALRGNKLSGQLDREFGFHVAELVDELMSTGMSRSDAEREARRRFGNYAAQKERTHDHDVNTFLESVLTDIRYALRALRSSPGFTVAAVLSLALGIGANTAIFSLLNALVLRQLPVTNPDQLVQVVTSRNDYISNPVWELLRDRQHSLAGTFALSQRYFDLSSGGETRRAEAHIMSGDAFRVLGVGAVLGRVFTVDDDRPGCPLTAVLSAAFWQRQFGGDRNVVGKVVPIGGNPAQIIGVSRPGFTGVNVGSRADLFVPVCSIAILDGQYNSLHSASSNWLRVIGRLPSGSSVQQASAGLSVLAPQFYTETASPKWDAKRTAEYRATTMSLVARPAGLSNIRGTYRGALYVLMGVVGVLLLIACANVANLMLSRAAARQSEIAVRMGLGASRLRVMRQLLTESAVLALISAVCGALFALWSSRLIVGIMGGTGIGGIFLDLAPDVRVLGFTVLVACATAVLFGVAPAWRSVDINPQGVMRGGGRGGSRRLSGFMGGKGLIVAQLALSLVLVIAATLLGTTLQSLTHLDAGFDPAHVQLVDVNLRYTQLGNGDHGATFDDVARRLGAIPGVTSVSRTNLTPLDGNAQFGPVYVDGSAPRSEKDATVYFNSVGTGFFHTLSTPVIAGREFNDADRPGSPRVAVVNEAFAHHFFGNVDPIGRQFRQFDSLAAPFTIVGVTRDVRYESLRAAAVPMGYLAMGQDTFPQRDMLFAMRSSGNAQTLRGAVTAAVTAIDPAISLEFSSLTQQVTESLSRERLLAMLSAFFGGVALLLAGVGLYGTMAYRVAQRRHEIGIRMALGADRSNVLRMVAREVGEMVAIGLGAGIVLALVATRLVAAFLYGATATDPLSYVLAILVLLGAASIAGYLPARRASQQDPMVALRGE